MKNNSKGIVWVWLAVFLVLFAARDVSAHVIVRPNSVGIGATQVFNMAVPSEEDVPTVAVKLVLPDGLNFVVPNVKPGWKASVKTVATGKKILDDDGNQVDEMKPIEIDWIGGSIPSGQRDEFNFQAQVSATPTTLDWKAYQTYSDGTKVSWDQTPGQDAENPYSVTEVVDDLSNSGKTANNTSETNIALALSAVAIVFSIVALNKLKQR